MNSSRLIRAWLVLLLIIVVFRSTAGAKGPGWESKQVDWRMTGGARIKAINYPQGKVPTLFCEQEKYRAKPPRKKILATEAASRLGPLTEQSTATVIANVIDSPPIDGFVPWIAVAVTDARFSEEDIIFEAEPNASVIGNYLVSNPPADYAIGIFDTGASAHVMSFDAAAQTGLSSFYLTSNTIEIAGVTGSVDAWVSQPIGLFIDGLGAIEPDGLLLDDSGMMGEYNVSIAVGDAIESPNLPTAIGSPLSVYFAAAFRNDQEVTVTHNSEEFTGPDITFYGLNDSNIPNYSNVIPLELRPRGGVNVQYIPTFNLFDPTFEPQTPSIIIGNLSQSVFFVHSVDLYEGEEVAYDKDRFMFDTGAQVTVIGSRIAARLGLNPESNDFEVVIQGVTGDTITAPGFYIDALEIPALGQWLSFTNVPVVLLDVSSPEGGTVDGIIGMNLFVDFNFVLRGGGLFLQDDPTVEYEPIGIIGDVAPPGGDGVVNTLDLVTFAASWLATSESPNWNPECDMAPAHPDGTVDFLDFAVLGEHWREGT